MCIFSVGSPVTPNPTIQSNSTHITLLWSPPFLWPGKRIHHYNVFFTSKTQYTFTYYQVNSSYNDQVVSLTKKINQNESLCTEIVFFISAFDISASEQLQTFITSEQIRPSSKNQIQEYSGLHGL